MSSTSKNGLLALSGTFLGLSTVSVSLRLYLRKRGKQRLYFDDFFALLGVVSFIGSCIVVFLFVHYKILGYSSSDFTSEETMAMNHPSGKLGYAFNWVNTTTLAAIKLSALFLYRRVFVTGAKRREWFDVVILTLVAIVIGWYITFMFLASFQCPGHFNAVEDGEATKYCTLNESWALGLAISDFLLDLIVLLLPVPRVWCLHTTLLKKLSIIGVFALAFVGLGASIARLYFYVVDQGAVFWATHDYERMYTQIIYIQMLESGVSITAVNFPCLWGLFTGKLSEFTVKMLRSLVSLTSLDRVTSEPERQGSRESKGVTNRTGSVSDEVKPSKTALGSINDARREEQQPWTSQPLALRGDLESQTIVGAYAAHDAPGEEMEHEGFGSHGNSIRVDKSFEVK